MFKMFSKVFVNITASFCLISNLGAVSIKTELLRAKDLDQIDHFIFQTYGYDCTIITFEGLPANGKIEINLSRLTEKEVIKIPDIIVGNNGIGKLVVSGAGFLPGEVAKYQFQFPENEKKEVEITPFPILAKSSIDEATVSAEMDMANGFTIKLENFGDNDKVIMKSISHSEVLQHTLLVNNSLDFGYLPAVVGKNGGVAKLSFQRPSGEILTIELPWGLEMLRYIVNKDGKGGVRSIIEDKKELKKIPGAEKYFKKLI
jgi:hypothetical protein